MNRNQTATVGLMAMLVILALAAAAMAMASPMPAAGAGAAEPVIRVRDTGDVFIVRWRVPEGVAPQEQTVDAWTDDGYRRTSSASVSVADDARQVEVHIDRTNQAGTAYGFTVSMLVDGERIQSKAKYLFPHGPMDKRAPSGLEALWHEDELLLTWVPGRNHNYVGQVAKCRLQEPDSNWETKQLSRRHKTAVFDGLDSDRSYVCRVEARKANGHRQMTKAANANRKRIDAPGDVGLSHTGSGANTVTFIWSVDGEDVEHLLVQREGPLPDDYSPAYPGWQTLARLDADATSHVDSIDVDDEATLYNYRLVAVGERGGSTVSDLSVCRLERDGEVDRYDCGRSGVGWR